MRWTTAFGGCLLGAVAVSSTLGCANRAARDATNPSAEGPEAASAAAPSEDRSAQDVSPGPLAAQGPRPEHGIFRSELDLALSRGPGYLLYELGPEPFRVSGKFVGWEITRVFPDEPRLCADGCDLEVGDIILSVNGDRIETPQALSDMLETLPSADALVVKSLRDEKRRVVTYPLVEG